MYLWKLIGINLHDKQPCTTLTPHVRYRTLKASVLGACPDKNCWLETIVDWRLFESQGVLSVHKTVSSTASSNIYRPRAVLRTPTPTSLSDIWNKSRSKWFEFLSRLQDCKGSFKTGDQICQLLTCLSCKRLIYSRQGNYTSTKGWLLSQRLIPWSLEFSLGFSHILWLCNKLDWVNFANFLRLLYLTWKFFFSSITSLPLFYVCQMFTSWKCFLTYQYWIGFMINPRVWLFYTFF